MSPRPKPVTILIVDDDDDDRMLTLRALKETPIANDVESVRDGEELMDYLHRRGAYRDPASAPAPGLILLDLNMPRKDGREALEEIKAHPRLRRIPVVVLTTSDAEEDLRHAYDAGANAYIKKPVTFIGLVNALAALKVFWLEIVRRPPLNDE